MNERILNVFREIFDNDQLQLTDATTAKDVPGWDSLAQVKLIIALEEEFSTTFTTREVAEMSCVGDLKAALRRRGFVD